MIDLHLHTSFSFDSKEPPQSYIDAAKSLGAPALGFSEHYDYDAYLEGAGLELCNLDAYLDNVEKLKSANPQLCILKGIEFGYSKAAAFQYEKLTKRYSFDYVINSVHTLPDRGDCYNDGFFTGYSLRDSYCQYLRAVLESLKVKYDYQIVGHVGYASRYRKGVNVSILYSDFSDLIGEILKEIIAREKCLEINTSVGTSGSEFLPDKSIIERYIKLGGRLLSFGSDAHAVARFCKGEDCLKQYLNGLGVHTLYYYKDRKAVPYSI